MGRLIRTLTGYAAICAFWALLIYCLLTPQP